jgi:hypothetical protein
MGQHLLVIGCFLILLRLFDHCVEPECRVRLADEPVRSSSATSNA